MIDMHLVREAPILVVVVVVVVGGDFARPASKSEELLRPRVRIRCPVASGSTKVADERQVVGKDSDVRRGQARGPLDARILAAFRNDDDEITITHPSHTEPECLVDVVLMLLRPRQHHPAATIMHEHEPLRQRRTRLEQLQPITELGCQHRRDLCCELKTLLNDAH